MKWVSYVKGSQNLMKFQPVNVFVGMQDFCLIPIGVTIVVATPKHVKLPPVAGPFSAPGALLNLTIGAATTKADFMIQGDILGIYQPRFTSAKPSKVLAQER